ncbi:hypothetical protein R615_12195 [Thalassolituus oleivorans R6-15]|nr:hypothetical protein R615_12195 [Thalassolituus oleivorans R6-15]
MAANPIILIIWLSITGGLKFAAAHTVLWLSSEYQSKQAAWEWEEQRGSKRAEYTCLGSIRHHFMR